MTQLGRVFSMANKTSAFEKLVSILGQVLLEYWKIRDPVVILRECIEDREWFKGIVLSTAFLEGIGKTVLEGHFKEQIASERFKNLRLELIIMFLRGSGIIDQSTYSDMMKVKDFRDNTVHLEPFTEPKLKAKKAERIIGKAIICLQTLIEKLPASEKEIIELPPKPNVKKKEK